MIATVSDGAIKSDIDERREIVFQYLREVAPDITGWLAFCMVVVRTTRPTHTQIGQNDGSNLLTRTSSTTHTSTSHRFVG